jgi:hypothetical protein
MDIKETRRAQLKKWFAERDIPPKEKSYLSQLLSGTASFGERAARRLEAEYGMGHMFLDEVEGQNVPSSREGKETASAKLSAVKKVVTAGEMDLMWVSSEDRQLLTLFHGTDDDGRRAIMRAAEVVPRVIKYAAVGNKQQ